MWDSKAYYREHRDYYKAYREKNKEKKSQQMRERWNKLKLDPEWIEHSKLINIKSRIKRKLTLLALFGNKCAHCSCSDPRVLQVDHKRDNGREHRRIVTSNALHVRIVNGKENKDDYQLLCANCNWIKRLKMPDITIWRLPDILNNFTK